MAFGQKFLPYPVARPKISGHIIGSQLIKGNKSNEPTINKDWILSLKATEDSLKTRREMYGHSRGYLDFLKGFIDEGKII